MLRGVWPWSTRSTAPSTSWAAPAADGRQCSRVSDPAITSVDVQLQDGMSLPLHVASGHAIGVVDRSAKIAAFVARDADGHVVARVEP